jgi:hypothetical protein
VIKPRNKTPAVQLDLFGIGMKVPTDLAGIRISLSEFQGLLDCE